MNPIQVIDKESNTMYVGCEDGSILVYTYGSSKRLRAHIGQVLALTITSDSKWLVSSGEEHCLKVWDLNTLKCVKRIDDDGEQSTPQVCALVSNDPNYVWGASIHNATVSKWNLETGECEQDISIPCYTSKIAFSPDGTHAVYTDLYKVYILDLETENTINLVGHESKITAIAICSEYAVTACKCSVRIWNVDTGKCIYKYTTYKNRRDTNYVTAITISPDMEVFETTDANGDVEKHSIQSLDKTYKDEVDL
jgi:WD40 repeat protein